MWCFSPALYEHIPFNVWVLCSGLCFALGPALSAIHLVSTHQRFSQLQPHHRAHRGIYGARTTASAFAYSWRMALLPRTLCPFASRPFALLPRAVCRSPRYPIQIFFGAVCSSTSTFSVIFVCWLCFHQGLLFAVPVVLPNCLLPFHTLSNTPLRNVLAPLRARSLAFGVEPCALRQFPSIFLLSSRCSLLYCRLFISLYHFRSLGCSQGLLLAVPVVLPHYLLPFDRNLLDAALGDMLVFLRVRSLALGV